MACFSPQNLIFFENWVESPLGLAWKPTDSDSRSSMVIDPTSYTLWKISLSPPLYFLVMELTIPPIEFTRKYSGGRGTLLHDLRGKPEQFKFLFENCFCQWPRYRKKKRYTVTFGPHFCQQWSRWSDYSLSYTDPEYLLFIKSLNAFSFSFPCI